MATYRIFEENYGKLASLVSKLNKRAARLNLSPITISKGAPEYVTAEDGVTVDAFLSVTIEGESPRLNGYEFAATVQHAGEAGNILRTVPAWSDLLPEWVRTTDPGRCDHCKAYRRRVDTFIVAKGTGTDATFHQVGRQCLADFVGHPDVHGAAALAEMMSLISEACDAYAEPGMGRGEGTRLSLVESITYAAEAMLRMGWVSRSKAEALNKTATADVARVALRNYGKSCTGRCARPCLQHFEPSEAAVKLTDDALAWAPGWIERELSKPSSSDYVWNMKVVLANDVIQDRSFPLAASILGAYQREMERAERDARVRAETTSRHLGSVGERLTLTLTVTSFRYIDSDYGVSTLISYKTETGDVVKWFASGEHQVTVDETATYEATVKAHKEYNGVPETHVTRVKLHVSKDAKKELAKQRKAAKQEYERLRAEADALHAALPAEHQQWASWNNHTPELRAYNDARRAENAAYDAWKGL